jgi:excisionase family DNA binding protein
LYRNMLTGAILTVTVIFIGLMPRRKNPSIQFTTAKVARLIGVSKQTLLNWIRSGRVPTPETMDNGKYYRWTVSELEGLRASLLEEEQPE